MGHARDVFSSYDPTTRLEDCPADFLAKLAREYARSYLAMDGIWNGSVTRRVGENEAMECELVVWQRMANYLLPRIAGLLGIELPVTDLVEALRVWQITPDQVVPDVYTIEYDIKNRYHVVGTVTKCATLDRFEKNAPGMIKTLCHGVEVAAVVAQCQILHPRMGVTPLKLPPRANPGDVACQWEYKLDLRSGGSPETA